ncbi:MAG: hypothetical protein COA42_04325 [Alteromonadaceae bacterium]|nr:MAG: hypothetical protein COA42_04325 [Alteromonadaceae bacterium]
MRNFARSNLAIAFCAFVMLIISSVRSCTIYDSTVISQGGVIWRLSDCIAVPCPELVSFELESWAVSASGEINYLLTREHTGFNNNASVKDTEAYL